MVDNKAEGASLASYTGGLAFSVHRRGREKLMPGKNRQRLLEQKRARKKAAMLKPGFKSKYSQKTRFLQAHGGSGLDYPDKPWR